MRMCTEHWEQCQQAIKDRGLWHLVAESGDEAAKLLIAQVEGSATKRDYDPLMDLNTMINSNAIQCGGLYLLSGDYCPLCEAIKHTENDEIDEEWINGASDAILQYCEENGLQG